MSLTQLLFNIVISKTIAQEVLNKLGIMKMLQFRI